MHGAYTTCHNMDSRYPPSVKKWLETVRENGYQETDVNHILKYSKRMATLCYELMSDETFLMDMFKKHQGKLKLFVDNFEDFDCMPFQLHLAVEVLKFNLNKKKPQQINAEDLLNKVYQSAMPTHFMLFVLSPKHAQLVYESIKNHKHAIPPADYLFFKWLQDKKTPSDHDIEHVLIREVDREFVRYMLQDVCKEPETEAQFEGYLLTLPE